MSGPTGHSHGSMDVVFTNIGTIITGDWRNPFAPGDELSFSNGKIKAVGKVDQSVKDAADLVVDLGGMTVIPGLIDSHVHTTFGDYTPRQKTVGFLESYLHGGITSVISASEIHVPGRPSDVAGIKALALAAQRSFLNYRPGGMRVYAGSLILEPGLVEKDFAELEEQGVWLAKVGFGAFSNPSDVAPIVAWARKHKFKVMCHTGGASIPGSQPISADHLMRIQPDIAGHVNGGPIAMSDTDMHRIVKETTMALQIAQAGNIRSSILCARLAEETGNFDRLLMSSDTPTGTGMMPLGTIKTLTEMCTLAGIAPEKVLACATGNVAKIYGFNSGFLAPGKDADITVIDVSHGSMADNALDGMAIGDIPAIGAVISGGVPRFLYKSRNTPPPLRKMTILQNRCLQTFIEDTPYHCC